MVTLVIRAPSAVGIFTPNPESLLTMADRTLTEGDSGTTNMTFSLIRGSDGLGTISFSYQTVAGTATAGVDYTAISGTSTITSGETKTFNVPIIGDAVEENDETFTFRIYNLSF